MKIFCAKPMLKAVPVAFFLSAVTANALAATVYSQDFESGVAGVAWSGAGSVQGTGGLSAFGFGNLHLKNDVQSASVLTLSGLAPHSTMTLSFSLALWDSIDIGSDQFVITADSTTLYNSVDFGNYFPADNIGHGPGSNITAPFTAFAVPDYGYNSGFHDSARAVSFTFDHSSTGVVISFQFPNSQGAPDESFGLDNVIVQTNAVVGAIPEPETYAMMLAGLGLLGFMARRRKQ